MKCSRVRKNKAIVCAGDMIDPIVLHHRDITEPDFQEVDYGESFTAVNESIPEILSMVNTVRGRSYFDGVGDEIKVTHEVVINFDPEVTSETWVEFVDPNGNRRFDIISGGVEDYGETHEFQKLSCVDRGLISKGASKA